MSARSSYDRMVWDQNSSCEILHVRRNGYFDVKAFLNTPSLTTLVRFLAEDKNAGQFLGSRGGENDVIACNWSKDILQPCGVFSFQLKGLKGRAGARTWFNIIRPGDVVVIFMDDAKDYSVNQLFTGKMITVGVVDRCTKIEATTGEGADTTVVSVMGRDLGTIFLETSTVFDPSFAQIEQALFTEAYQARLYRKQSAAQSPVENLLTIIDLFYNERASGSQLVAAQWQFQHKLTRTVSLASLIDVSTFVQQPMFGYALIDSLSPTQAGNVWTLMETYANRVVNELFIDVRDYSVAERDFLAYQSDKTSAFVTAEDASTQRALVQQIRDAGVFRSAASETLSPARDASRAEQVVALVHRQMPYDTDAFMRLPQVDVYHSEVFETELSYASHDVVNYFRIRSPVLPPEFQEATYGIKVNVGSVYKFGIRRMEPETMYFFASSDASSSYDTGSSRQEDFTAIFDYYIGLLSTWHAANDAMLAGAMTVRFRPDIRVGMRLRLHVKPSVDTDVHDFYVQAVSHNFVVEPGASRTHVTLVRGIRPGQPTLEANLRWSKSGPALPPELNTYGRFTALGFEMEAASGERIQNDQLGTADAAKEDE